MKSSVKYLLSALIALLLLSCSREVKPEPVVKPQPEPEEHRSYTIMFYGSGGGIDDCAEGLMDVVRIIPDIPENIKIVGQIKWNKGYKSQVSNGRGGVSRFMYNHRSNMVDYSEYAGPEFRIDEAENLAEFIEWARETAPAEEYIMVFFGHGNGYHPSFDGVTRGTLRDNMYTTYLGVDAIRQAFEMADAKFVLTEFVSCYMNTLEYITELEPYTDYYYGSNHALPATNAEIYLLVNGLMLNYEQEDAVLMAGEYALKEYGDMVYPYIDDYSYDISITRSSSIAALNGEIRNFVDIVVQLYDEEAEIGAEAMQQKYNFTTKDIDEALGGSYYFNERMTSSAEEWYRCTYTHDIVSIVNMVAERTNHPQLMLCAREVKLAAQEAQVCQSLCHSDEVYYGLALVNGEEWAELGFDDANYEALAFDRATGWSRLLKRNSAVYTRHK